MTRRLFAAAAGAAAALALTVLPASGASAHDYLVSTDPAADSTAAAPIDSVTLTFSAPVLDLTGDGGGTLLVVTGADGRHFETGCAAVAGTTITAPVSLGAPGQYTVTYQAVSSDGHTVSDSYGFRYEPPAGTPAASGSAATPCGATASPTPEPTMTTQATTEPAPVATDTASTPQPTKTSEDTSLPLVIGIGIAIAVLVAAAVIVVILTARRKAPQGEEPDTDTDTNADPRS